MAYSNEDISAYLKANLNNPDAIAAKMKSTGLGFNDAGQALGMGNGYISDYVNQSGSQPLRDMWSQANNGNYSNNDVAAYANANKADPAAIAQRMQQTGTGFGQIGQAMGMDNAAMQQYVNGSGNQQLQDMWKTYGSNLGLGGTPPPGGGTAITTTPHTTTGTGVHDTTQAPNTTTGPSTTTAPNATTAPAAITAPNITRPATTQVQTPNSTTYNTAASTPTTGAAGNNKPGANGTGTIDYGKMSVGNGYGVGYGSGSQTAASGGQGSSGYGYGNGPNQGGGYYEQQTPVGSFAAANQQYGQATGAYNPYIGQNTQQPGQVGPVGTQYAGSNPYLGQNTQQVSYQGAQGAGTNAYAGQNDYLNKAIDGTVGDMTKAYNNITNPQYDRAAQQSGSFGNTGVEAARAQGLSDFEKNVGQTTNNMRMQDYTAQQGLAENQLNRNQGLNQFNAGNQFSANMANAGFNSTDLTRNMQGVAGQNQFNASQGNNMGQFNANLGLGQNQFGATLAQNDLNRNSNLMQNMGQFNAGAQNQMSQFNAGQGNALNQFNAGSGNQMLNQVRQNQWQGGQNDANRNLSNQQFYSNQGWQGGQNDLNRNLQNNQFYSQLGQNNDQFNKNYGLSVDQYNSGLQNQAFQNYWTNQNNTLNAQNLGLNGANNIQNTLLNYLTQFSGLANGAGGNGGTTTGTNSQNLQANPLLGGLGGYQLWNALFGGGNNAVKTGP